MSATSSARTAGASIPDFCAASPAAARSDGTGGEASPAWRAAGATRSATASSSSRTSLADNNRVARDFYNGPLWPKFRFWEWFILVMQRRRAAVAEQDPPPPAARAENLTLLDVAIGDGVYLDWLPRDWSIVGIDISTVQLAACRQRAGRATCRWSSARPRTCRSATAGSTPC